MNIREAIKIIDSRSNVPSESYWDLAAAADVLANALRFPPNATSTSVKIEVNGKESDRKEVIQRLADNGFLVTSLGPYSNKKMFPKVDVSRFKLVAEKPVK